MRKTLAVDFDGTLCQYQKFGPITNPPNEGAKQVIDVLRANGWTIIIHICRASQVHEDYKDSIKAIIEWLQKYEIVVDDITADKPIATAYIDDRGLRFTNWQDIKNYFI